jgi:hypothetical protein
MAQISLLLLSILPLVARKRGLKAAAEAASAMGCSLVRRQS